MDGLNINGMTRVSSRVSTRSGRRVTSSEAGRTTARTPAWALALAGLMAFTPLDGAGQAAGQAAGQTAGQATSVDGGAALSLSQAVGIALDVNREVRDAQLGLRVAEEQVSEAWSNVYPELNLNADYTRNLKPAVSFLPAAIFDPSAGPDDYIQVQFGADNSWMASLSVDQKLFDPAVFLGVGAAGRFRALQLESVRGREQNVVTRVRSAFYSLLLSQEQLRLTENSVARVRRSLTETEAMNRAGVTSDYDVLRLQVELANLEPNLRRAENQVRDDRRMLAVELAMDLDDADALTVAGSLAEMDLSDVECNTAENQDVLRFAGLDPSAEMPDADALVALARERRSDLRQLELTERLRHTEVRLEQVQYLPTVSLFGSYSVNAQQNGNPDFFGTGINDRAYSSLAGVRVSVPVFQGFRRDARIDQKRAALRQAETQTELVTDQATTQIRALADQVDEARVRAEAQAFAVEQAQRGFDIASAQYREGIGSQLERTDAENALRQSEFNYAQAVYDYLVNRARLDEAVGMVPMVDRDLMTVEAAEAGDAEDEWEKD